MVALTYIFTFEAAHCLEGYAGDCAHLHGHSYRLEVTVKGPVQADGMVIDFAVLKTLVEESIINRVDHQYLNEVVSFVPTCENLLLWFWKELGAALKPYPHLVLERLVLWETSNARAEITREMESR
ncbi:6-pyruvoyl tetrahydropterin synthase/QueD family protein [Moorella glycerini]|uniref:6-carboxy-5,6,7,8-tetrahydropterin synthase n=1 Tax=Neomoorella stamsii TaxID=1266720 RepID=A0A9X7P655_9FIRM|nr:MULTISPECIES: 6-carboxytetrahydropterin synthase QueD [Moorella]PRR72796.1 6-carboxy-5,6,7,8-tetrahydropterin synthase [Moorella stamsii]CEP66267.1 6-pyruvoyl tetrahydropterin synthase/QueD family protein [Moorella glycerini]CEP68141.1 6-pyruvoyl tetrahydropterin synthase/QueD family protein [Moorella glycerini]